MECNHRFRRRQRGRGAAARGCREPVVPTKVDELSNDIASHDGQLSVDRLLVLGLGLELALEIGQHTPVPCKDNLEEFGQGVQPERTAIARHQARILGHDHHVA